MKPISSRRKFLGRAAATASLLTTPSVSSAPLRSASPNDTLRVGLIGCGSRGPYVGYVFHETPRVEVVALCDVHRARREGTREKYAHLWGKPTLHDDYRRLLDAGDVDAVIVATTAHWHVLATVDACAAGKDVYVEKPVGTSIAEGRAAVAAARRHGRVVQVGTQQRSWPHYREAVEIVQSGALGEISEVHVWDVKNQSPGFGNPADTAPPPGLDWDFWLGPSPRVPYNPNRFEQHYWYFDYDGSWQVAWGVHHFDIVHWAMAIDTPRAATAMGANLAFRDDREWPDTFTGSCLYPAGKIARNGFLMKYTLRAGCEQPVEGRPHGKAFYGTRGTLILNRQGYEVRAETRDGKLLTEERRSSERLAEHEAVRRHVADFVECVRSRRRPTADIEIGHRSTVPGLLMNIAWRTGRTVRWDAASEKIPGDEAANRLVTKVYRAPWRLPPG